MSLSIRHPCHPCRSAGRPDHRRSHHTDLSDLDLSPDRARRQQRLLLRAHRPSDARRARREPGRAGGRALRAGVRQRHGRHPRRAVAAAAAATTSSPRRTSTAARGASSPRSSRASASTSRSSTRPIRRTSKRPSGRKRSCSGWRRRPIRCCTSPTSPRCAAIAAASGIITVVDNTFATPVLQQPLALGADVVVHSTTKYINGHSDVIGGAVLTNDEGLYDELKFLQNAIGAVPGPQDCFLILRGVKTLGLRMERHCSNAELLAQVPPRQRPRAARLLSGPRRPAGPRRRRAADDAIRRDRLVRARRHARRDARLHAPPASLDARRKPGRREESLLSSGHDDPRVGRAGRAPKVGIGDGLIRLSAGLEDVRDLIDDLEQALARTRAADREEAVA